MEDRVAGLGFGAGGGSVSVAGGWQEEGSGWEVVGEVGMQEKVQGKRNQDQVVEPP